MSRDRSQYYQLGEPWNEPSTLAPKMMYRVWAKATCRKCGKSCIARIKCNRYRNAVGVPHPNPEPDPSDYVVVTSLLVAAHNIGVGNPRWHKAGCPVALLPMGTHHLGGVARS